MKKNFIFGFLMFCSLIMFSCTDANALIKSVKDASSGNNSGGNNVTPGPVVSGDNKFTLNISDISVNNLNVALNVVSLSDPKIRYVCEIFVKKEYDGTLGRYDNYYEAHKAFYAEFFKDNWGEAMIKNSRAGNVSGNIFEFLENREPTPGESYALVFYAMTENAELVKDIYINDEKIENGIYSEILTLKEQKYEDLPELTATMSAVKLLPEYGVSVTLSGDTDPDAAYFVSMQAAKSFVGWYIRKGRQKDMIYKILESARGENTFPELYKVGQEIQYFSTQNLTTPKQLVYFKYSQEKGVLSKVGVSEEFTLQK